MKTLKHLILLSATTLLASCGGSSSSSAALTSSAATSSVESSAVTSSEPAPAKAKVNYAFISPAKLGYLNHRPTYNYYLTTFSFKTLELYDNGIYRLSLSSSTFSALVLPEEGNAVSGNEQGNSLLSYFGTYTSTVDDLDPEMLNVSLSAPGALIGVDDGKGAISTLAWTEAMKANWADKTYAYDPETKQQTVTGEVQYDTGAEYLAAHSYEAITDISVSTTKGNMDNFDLVDAKNNTVSLNKDVESFVSSFISPAKLNYINHRPNYNYYLTTFAFQNLVLLDESNYALSITSSTFSALVLSEDDNTANGNEQGNSLMTYYGTYTAVKDDLDEDLLNISLSAPTRLFGVDDAKGFIDTDNWTETMKANWADKTYAYDPETKQQTVTGEVQYDTGAEYLAAHSYKAISGVSADTVRDDLTYIDPGL